MNSLTFQARLKADVSGCLLWQGAVGGSGYGNLVLGGKHVNSHRAAWILSIGPIPPGMCVCHKCDVKLCCNPDHLFLGTYRDNNLDAKAKGRSSPPPRGNEFTVDGKRPPATKLCAAEVAVLKAMLKAGVKGRTIASKFGVSEFNVSAIKRGITWRHVEPLPHYQVNDAK